jgi:TolB-like protein/Flp pilus assembly protein TadD
MTPARLQTIEEIFRAALDQEPDQISAFLDTACEGDELLRRKVERLLASRKRVGSFIETSVAGIATRIIEKDQTDLLVGQTIGHYKIAERIGAGGMGEVYLATDVTAGRKAALKLLPARFTADAERLKRFRQEARAVVALNHPNILTVYEIGEDHSIHYIASELIEGETLRQRLERGHMQVNEAVDVAIQVASALAAAHQAGIVHRDIKPENIMLRPDGYVKVLDFGIAKLAEQEVPATMPKDEALLLVETNLGSILGTVRYMSPEQACGAQVDKSTDIWSLGVVLYEMVTGHAPFTGDTPREVMTSIFDKEPPPLTSYIRQTPAELQQIISKTLRKDRGQRYHSAHELLEALKGLRRKLEFESFFVNGFFGEVKRRKVYRVAAAYIIAAVGIIQLASAAFPAWELPNWALRLVIVLLLIGFPLALILGWAFDITAQGVRATPRAPPGTHRRRNAIMLVATGVIISAAAGFFLLPQVSPNKLDKSIAVLPLENLSDEKENAFFADGVHDELLSNLAKIKDLKVISRTSVMRYKSGITRNLKEIARQLGVGHVLEGSVRRAGNQLRVSVQLIDARTDTHLWAEHYDRDVADVFAIQSEIAASVAEQLRAHLSTREKAAIAQAPTHDVLANELYIRAKELETAAEAKPSGKESLLKAVHLLEEAVTHDPGFVLAYCLLCRVHLDLYWIGFDHTPARRELANAALRNATRLQPDAGEVHVARANYFYHAFRDYDRARADLDLARSTLPNSAEIYWYTASINRRQARWNDAIRDFERAIELDPRNFSIVVEAAFTHSGLRRFAESRQLLERALLESPGDHFVRAELARLDFLERGELDSWSNQLSAIVAEGPTGASHVALQLVWCALAARDREAAARALTFIPPEGLIEPRGNVLFPREWLVGLVAWSFGDKAGAQTAFSAARPILERVTVDQPEYAPAWSLLGIIDAALGGKENAIWEGRHACELLPVSKDSWEGPSWVTNLATIYAWTGDNDAALQQLGNSASNFGVTYGELKLFPIWDSLRGDPRFEKIVASLAPKL